MMKMLRCLSRNTAAFGKKEVSNVLKTNSKKAKENIRIYIADNFSPEGYTDKNFDTFSEKARFILTAFRNEKPALGSYANMSEAERFEVWASGLPSVFDTCYYYSRSATDDLAAILDESEEEKAKYTDESKSEKLLTALIYRELVRGNKD